MDVFEKTTEHRLVNTVVDLRERVAREELKRGGLSIVDRATLEQAIEQRHTGLRRPSACPPPSPRPTNPRSDTDEGLLKISKRTTRSGAGRTPAASQTPGLPRHRAGGPLRRQGARARPGLPWSRATGNIARETDHGRRWECSRRYFTGPCRRLGTFLRPDEDRRHRDPRRPWRATSVPARLMWPFKPVRRSLQRRRDAAVDKATSQSGI